MVSKAAEKSRRQRHQIYSYYFCTCSIQ